MHSIGMMLWEQGDFLFWEMKQTKHRIQAALNSKARHRADMDHMLYARRLIDIDNLRLDLANEENQ